MRSKARFKLAAAGLVWLLASGFSLSGKALAATELSTVIQHARGAVWAVIDAPQTSHKAQKILTEAPQGLRRAEGKIMQIKQESYDIRKAQRRYERGVDSLQTGGYLPAAKAFRDAYNLAITPPKPSDSVY